MQKKENKNRKIIKLFFLMNHSSKFCDYSFSRRKVAINNTERSELKIAVFKESSGVIVWVRHEIYICKKIMDGQSIHILNLIGLKQNSSFKIRLWRAPFSAVFL